MTTTENEYIKGEATHVGIYLLEMTTIENLTDTVPVPLAGIYLLKMTTIETHNKDRYIDNLVFTCLK